MNNTNNNTIDSVKYSFYNIGIGTYNVYFDGSGACYLFSTPKLKTPKLKYLKHKLNEDDSYSILDHIKNLKHEIIKISKQYYCDYNIILICEEKYSCDEKHIHRCDEEHKYREIYIKINNEEPLSIHKENIISELGWGGTYNISNFSEIFDHSGIITSYGYKYYINNKAMSILKKYFKCEDGKIVCMYNNKKEIAKLTIITEKVMGGVGMLQSLELKINNKKFTFYVNRYKYLGFADRGEYKLLVFHIHHDSNLNINQLLGYEPYKNVYYDLTFYIDNKEKNYVLDNINQEIAKKFRNKENIDYYTYIHNNNKNYGLIYNKVFNKIYKKFGEITTIFETILDISLLKPVDEWDNEEINTKKKYYEKEYKDNTENNPNKDNTEK